MWVSLQEEILAKAKLLKENGYTSTGKWCKHIHKNLNQYSSRQELEMDVKDLFVAFTNEYIYRTDLGNKELREEYLHIVQVLLEQAIKHHSNPKRVFRELIPLLDQQVNTNRAINEVAEVFKDMGDQFLEVRTYASLFIFMLHIEGSYFPTIRALCALKRAGEEKDVDFQHLYEMSYANIKRSLGKIGESLFVVYENDGKRIRNAVAHANFKLKNGKLSCWNVDVKTRKENWRKEFTYDEFSSVVVDIYSISHAYSFWYLLRELAEKIAEHENMR